MAHLAGSSGGGGYCIDRFEVYLVDQTTGERLSPFYPPEPKELRNAFDYWSVESTRVGPEAARRLPLPPVPKVMRGAFVPSARSQAGVLPQGYMSQKMADLACRNAGKRLCSEDEWTRACRSKKGTRHPYADAFEPGRCNVFRRVHPAFELHGNSSIGHLDPRLHLVWEEGVSPLLAATGSHRSCSSEHENQETIFDMVGNLDEWIDDPGGTFLGGFYSRATREGCEAKIENHSSEYFDYSIGTRCCASPHSQDSP